MLVDTNFHVVAPPRERDRYPLDPLPGATDEFTEAQSTTVEQCLALMDGAGVDQAYLFASRFHGFDNSYCADSVAKHPDRFVAVANVNVYSPRAPDEVSYWIQERGMHGVRLWGGGRGIATWIDQEPLRPVWRRIRRLGVPANAQTTRPEAFAPTRRFLERFPDIPLTINYLGHIPVAKGAGSAAAHELFALAEFPLVRVNIPVGFLGRCLEHEPAADALLDGLLDHFGARRLIWSAFYPSEQERPFADSVAIVRAVAQRLAEPDREAFLGGAARDLYPSLRSGA